MASNTKFPIGVTIAAVVIFAAAFMPWGKIHRPDVETPFGGQLPFGGGPFQGMQFSMTVTGWNGSVNLGGFELPNWLVVLAAAGVTALRWLKTAAAYDAPPAVLLALAAYGFLHAGFAVMLFVASDKGSPGVGSFLTTFAFVAMLATLVQQSRGPAAAGPSPNQPGDST